MNEQIINLTEAEWSVMECLWHKSPRTGRETTEHMQKSMGWNRSTTLTLLSRLESKGAVGSDSKSGKKTFYPLLHREDVAMQQTQDFLSRVYNGSISLMLSALTKKQSLSQAEINELYDLLQKMEEVKTCD